MSNDGRTGSPSFGRSDNRASTRSSPPPPEEFDSEAVQQQRLAQECDDTVENYQIGAYMAFFISLLSAGKTGQAGEDLFDLYYRRIQDIDDTISKCMLAQPLLIAQISNRKCVCLPLIKFYEKYLYSVTASRGDGVGSPDDDCSMHQPKQHQTETSAETSRILTVMPWTGRRKARITTLCPALLATQQHITLIG